MQFASDLDDMTRQQLAYGHSLMQLLRQEKYHPMKQHEQIIVLVAALSHVMQDIPSEKIKEFKHGLLTFIEKQASHICREIETGELTEEIKEDIVRFAREYLRQICGGDE